MSEVQNGYKGAELEDVKFSFQGGKAVLAGKLVHSGKIGDVELQLTARLDAKPVLDAVIDEVEKIIPGDQKDLAEKIKLAISMIKL